MIFWQLIGVHIIKPIDDVKDVLKHIETNTAGLISRRDDIFY